MSWQQTNDAGPSRRAKTSHALCSIAGDSMAAGKHSPQPSGMLDTSIICNHLDCAQCPGSVISIRQTPHKESTCVMKRLPALFGNDISNATQPLHATQQPNPNLACKQSPGRQCRHQAASLAGCHNTCDR